MRGQGEFTVTGKLNVTGLIDPTGMEFSAVGSNLGIRHGKDPMGELRRLKQTVFRQQRGWR